MREPSRCRKCPNPIIGVDVFMSDGLCKQCRYNRRCKWCKDFFHDALGGKACRDCSDWYEYWDTLTCDGCRSPLPKEKFQVDGFCNDCVTYANELVLGPR